MTSHQHRSRVPAGVTTGGQFATGARGEAQLDLSAPVEAKVAYTGTPGPGAVEVGEALVLVPGVGDVRLHAEREDSTSFIATIHDRDYRIVRHGEGHYAVALVDGPYLGSRSTRDRIGDQMTDTLRAVQLADIESKTLKSVERMTREEFSSELITRPPAAMHRDPRGGCMELGFAVVGDHIKVRLYGDKTTGTGLDAVADGQLFGYSTALDGLDGVTERQRTRRINKALDSIGPDRAYSERYLRRFMALARDGADQRIAADPILAAQDAS